MVRFELEGESSLDILADRSPLSQPIDCRTRAPMPGGRPRTEPVGAAGLSFNDASQLYTYRWQTRFAWGGTCRRFFVDLDDGRTRSADFRFERFEFVLPTMPSPEMNEVPAGADVRVLFKLGGASGLSIIAQPYPRSQPIVLTGAASSRDADPTGRPQRTEAQPRGDLPLRWEPLNGAGHAACSS
jgi:hypothetical protein